MIVATSSMPEKSPWFGVGLSLRALEHHHLGYWRFHSEFTNGLDEYEPGKVKTVSG